MTSEQIQLSIYLIGAIAIGFIFGYLLAISNMKKKRKNIQVKIKNIDNKYNNIVTILDDIEDQKADK
jgi:hypothetical protein